MSGGIKFNAGKVLYDEESKKCEPLAIKGQVTISQCEDESMYDFVWSPKANTSNIEKDELLIMPGDVTFKQVKSCKTGRVFALTYLSSGAKYLYWLQDPGDDQELDELTAKDEALVKEIEVLFAPEADEDDDQEEVDTENTTSAVGTEDTKDSVTEVPLPLSIDDLLTEANVKEYFSTLTDEEAARIMAPLLPEEYKNSRKLDKDFLLQVFQSGLFKRQARYLSGVLHNVPGSGMLLSQSLGFDYKGEGEGAFLQGVKQLAENDESQQKPSKDELADKK